MYYPDTILDQYINISINISLHSKQKRLSFIPNSVSFTPPPPFWITIATHTEYLILIIFLRQQWFRERACMLCYTYSSSPSPKYGYWDPGGQRICIVTMFKTCAVKVR